ncbi:hypothetical protein DCCM_0741 [Desulfocucumis palustris]|uniref:Uncharacterized protein n=1 Tax=Desulfocucumis palustris TaxID=1898651 RepID=A0A2L2X8N8_9FIRM|nr:hypothetical protein DCCM_0741 [Desulfocucumis palustris]
MGRSGACGRHTGAITINNKQWKNPGRDRGFSIARGQVNFNR